MKLPYPGITVHHKRQKLFVAESVADELGLVQGQQVDIDTFWQIVGRNSRYFLELSRRERKKPDC